jgi:bifunctional UDP-N-acetylglucosamine pyrophosphorylase/glucosamine-1-phosphate N-acetyltransferase
MMRARINTAWMAHVTFRDPASTVVEPDVELGVDVELGRNVSLRGRTKVGHGARIDDGVVLTDTEVGAGVQIKPYCIATESVIGPNAIIGPFAHLRPGTKLAADVHIGNFVETKKTIVHARAKANHLSYLGDGEIGEGSNIGAGTIFCNYDGFNKHRTTLGRSVFVGSDSQLVAPVTIGDEAYVATGTTVTRDVPAGDLAIGRARQENKPGYAAKLRAKLAARAKPK